jgi:hypothetical protein
MSATGSSTARRQSTTNSRSRCEAAAYQASQQLLMSPERPFFMANGALVHAGQGNRPTTGYEAPCRKVWSATSTRRYGHRVRAVRLSDKGMSGSTLGLDQYAHFALAAVWHNVVIGHEALSASRDSSWGNYLHSLFVPPCWAPPSFMHQFGSSPEGMCPSSY